MMSKKNMFFSTLLLVYLFSKVTFLSAGPPGFTNGTTARGKLIESRVKLNELEALKPKSDELPKSNTKVRFNLSVATTLVS